MLFLTIIANYQNMYILILTIRNLAQESRQEILFHYLDFHMEKSVFIIWISPCDSLGKIFTGNMFYYLYSNFLSYILYLSQVKTNIIMKTYYKIILYMNDNSNTLNPTSLFLLNQANTIVFFWNAECSRHKRICMKIDFI